MTNRPRKSLAEYAAEAARSPDGGIECPKCQCRDFRTYRTDQRSESTYRYKACRHCGHKMITATPSTERIVRDVTPHESEEDDDPTTIQLHA